MPLLKRLRRKKPKIATPKKITWVSDDEWDKAVKEVIEEDRELLQRLAE